MIGGFDLAEHLSQGGEQGGVLRLGLRLAG
jgi:hypothetical protein